MNKKSNANPLSRLNRDRVGFLFFIRLPSSSSVAAVQMIKENDKSIANITIESGFNSSQAFNKIFKQHYKLTPSEYRKPLN